MLKKRQKSDAPWGVPFLFLKVYKISILVSNRNHFVLSKGNLREEMTTDDADLTGIFRSRRNGGNGRNFNYYLILMSIDNHAAWRA